MEIMDKELLAVINKQKSICDWQEGEPVEVFKRDGLPCVKYESGSWWHYDVKKGTMFPYMFLPLFLPLFPINKEYGF